MESTSSIETLLTQQTELLQQIYAAQLFIIGVSAAVFVTLLLYNALRKCF